MKRIILGIILYICFPGLVLAQKQKFDTLQAEIGDGASLYVIIKDAKGYDELSKYDLNKIFSELTSELKESSTRVARMKDFDGNGFVKPKEAGTSGFYFNYFLGFNRSQRNSYPEVSLYPSFNSAQNSQSYSGTQIYSFNSSAPRYINKVFSSPYLSASVNRDFLIMDKPRSEFGLKMGLEPFFSYEKLAITSSKETLATALLDKSFSPEFIDPNGTGNVARVSDTLAVVQYDAEQELIRWQYYDLNNEVSSYVSLPYNIIKAGFNFKLMPKFSLFNNEGKRSISLAVGPTIGVNVIRKSVTKISDQNITEPIIVSGMKPSALRLGFAAELGIGAVNVFAQYVKNSAQYIGRADQEKLVSSSYMPFNSNEFNTYVFNFGLKIGK
ncbi:MAG: hypothetical protein NXI00_19645 [Cytophagales bacterium]|nr:hypothetical protein [Cytophagales bacterium]